MRGRGKLFSSCLILPMFLFDLRNNCIICREHTLTSNCVKNEQINIYVYFILMYTTFITNRNMQSFVAIMKNIFHVKLMIYMMEKHIFFRHRRQLHLKFVEDFRLFYYIIFKVSSFRKKLSFLI